MGLNDTVSAERPHIAFFGMRNAGKSSVVNAVTGQELSIVSEIKGTTTDPVKKAMELFPLGPVVIIDTPGLDDEGKLGEQRVRKALDILKKTDIAVLVVDVTRGVEKLDAELIAEFEKRSLPYFVIYNKSDLFKGDISLKGNELLVSALTGDGVESLKNALGSAVKQSGSKSQLVADLLEQGDIVLLVIPIDESAPKGRLILPQQQTMRDILDAHCSFIACRETEVKQTLAALSSKPKLVITDSQAFEKVAKDTPNDIMLTSFSILFARYKGELKSLVRGARALEGLKDGDKVLISEGCTHHRQCNDIGSVKIPRWIEKYTGAKPIYEFTSGGEFPDNLSEYKLIVHCGGCMLNEKEMKNRIALASEAGVPIVNYGMAIAGMHGVLNRSLEPFGGAV